MDYFYMSTQVNIIEKKFHNFIKLSVYYTKDSVIFIESDTDFASTFI